MTTLGADRADLEQVGRITKQAGTSFYHGMRILPPDRRAAMYAVYAFCRVVDDIADEPAPIEHKRASLDAWRQRIRDLGVGKTSDAITRVLLPAMQAFGLREADFLAVIDGMQTDAASHIIAPSLAELDLYCDRVASAVGRLSVRAFGDSSPDADEVAHHLGRALQLTNILRDLAEDAARGRLYLPREWLDEAGVPADPAAALSDPRLTVVCSRVASEAERHFRAAFAAMRRCDSRAMRPARIMGETYWSLLKQLHRRGWTDHDAPPGVPTWRKLIIAARVLLRQ